MSCAGANFRERERIKRKRARWLRRFAELPPTERRELLAAMLELEAPRAVARPASSAPWLEVIAA